MQSFQKACRLRNGIVLRTVVLAALAVSAALLAPCRASAVIYQVDRSFSSNSFIATLTGTVGISLGSYTLMNSNASPFTSVDLTLTVNGISYSVDNVLTGVIHGTGEFLINATATSLTFSTANANGANPADLVFSDTFNVASNDRYAIGTDGASHFEAAYTGAGGGYVNSLVLPVQWGVAVVPEPSMLSLLAIPLAFLGFQMRRARKQI